MPGAGKARYLRYPHHGHRDFQLVRLLDGPLAVGRQHLRCSLDRIHRGAGIHLHQWLKPQRQGRDDAEVATSAAQRPEQVGVVLGADGSQHPVRGHNVGAQQGVGGEPMAPGQPALHDSPTAIQDASTEAVRELRGTLEVLREDDEQPGSGLDRLPALLERTRAAGLPAIIRVSGQQRRLPDEVDRAAYRIVQEALTNVTRHAGPAAAAVELEYSTQTLTVRVDDDGVGNGHAATPGLGLIGMRERVTALGGTLSADARAERGFRVEAQIPVPS